MWECWNAAVLTSPIMEDAPPPDSPTAVDGDSVFCLGLVHQRAAGWKIQSERPIYVALQLLPN